MEKWSWIRETVSGGVFVLGVSVGVPLTLLNYLATTLALTRVGPA